MDNDTTDYNLNPWWKWWCRGWKYIEEVDDVIPVNEEKILASLGYVTSNFVVTNNKNFKILKDIADFYLRYKKTVMESRCNQSTLDGFFSKS